MKKYIEQLQYNCINHSDYIAIKSNSKIKGITYGQLWDYSGRLYAYLKDHNYGREDMILICLPRGIRCLTALVGVLRAGAAFTILESTYPKDRIDYIFNDCNCKLVIDEQLYDESMKYQSLKGYETTDSHDACFAVYTSGSTGNPKGVLHEYGKLELIIGSKEKTIPGEGINAVESNPAPLNFVASISWFLGTTYYGRCAHVLSYDVARDVEKLSNYISENNIFSVFMTCSLFKKFKSFPSCLKRIYLGSEPCNGIYLDSVSLTNSYGSSETAFSATFFIIDKPYDVTPAGKNLMNIEIQVVDENGKVLPKGETGEIYVRDDYTRGYINLPEKNKEVFVDGMFHTGDLGYFNENGDLIVKGRKDDMIKINGNRIEPAEIENKLKHVLGVNNVVAKGFVSDKRSFICAYLLSNELKSLSLLDEKDSLNISTQDINDELSKYLPYYMLPTYYVVLDEFPKNVNGKLARKDLIAPSIDDYRQEYTAASNPTEKYLCELFSKIFNIEKVSINDDFYFLGGDSLSTIEFISECKLKGFTSTDIYKYRTVKKLAEYYDKYINDNESNTDQRNQKALEHSQPLLAEMKNVLDIQDFAVNSVMWNLPILYKLKDDIDLDRFKHSVDRVLKNHPVYCTEIKYDPYQVPYQKYNPTIYKEIEVVNTSEVEFESIKETLVKPFYINQPPYYRMALYKTESNVYFFFDHYHIISDGTSLGIIFRQISNCYYDKDYKLPEDYYYLMVRDEEKKRIQGEYEEITKYYKEFYKKYFVDSDCLFNLKTDNEFKTVEKFLMIESNIDAKQDDVNVNRSFISENEFFISSVLLAQAKFNNKNSSYIQWVFNGRDSSDKLDMTGLLFKSLPVATICDENKTIKEYYDEIINQVDYCSSHNSLRVSSIDCNLDNSIYFLFQKNIASSKDLAFAKEKIELNITKYSDSYIEMMIFANEDGSYRCTISYDSGIYKEESVKKFFEYFNEISYKLSKIQNLDSTYIKNIIG